jgi:PAS domain S-box-containing protein
MRGNGARQDIPFGRIVHMAGVSGAVPGHFNILTQAGGSPLRATALRDIEPDLPIPTIPCLRMKKLFISLSNDPPAGFEQRRPAADELRESLVAIYADREDTARKAYGDLFRELRGYLFTRSSACTQRRISPTCTHMTIAVHMEDSLADWASALLDLMQDHGGVGSENSGSAPSFDAIAELIPVCIFITDENMVLRYANQFALDLLGYDRSDLGTGVSSFNIIAPTDRDRALANYQKRKQGQESGPVEYMIRKKDGTTIPVLFNINTMKTKGRITGYCGGFIDISDWKSAVRKSREQFTMVFESSPSLMAVLQQSDGRILEANDTFCKSVGADKGQVTGRTMGDLGIVCEQAECSQIHEFFRKVGYDKKAEVLIRLKDSTEKTARFGGCSLEFDGIDCLLISGEDTTQRNRISKALRQSEHMLKLVMDTIPQHIFWKDRNSVYLGCNQNFARVAGVGSPDEIVGKTDYDLAWKREEAEFFRKIDQEVMQSQQPKYHIIEPQYQAEGKEAWLDTNKIPITDEHGKVVGMLGTYEDITERIKAEDQLHKTNEKLNKTVAELDRFVYSASHDLGAPLKSILGLIHIAKKDRDPQQMEEYLTYIENSVHKLEQVIQSLISYSRNSRLAINKESFRFGDLVQEIRDELAYLPDAPKVHYDLRQGRNTVLDTDRQRLKLILHNLINNSIKYSDPEKAQTVIQLAMQHRNGHYNISVTDNGIGIAKEAIDKIFTMFYRGTEHSEGTGLGLYIVKETVRMLNGDIVVHSVPGTSTVFKVKIPAG